ncbi:two-component system, NarL family, sensor histidine kinase YdfH [Terribacillus saccharophilus]|uniref:histidine kinase n=1 Tax=Terribacillus saccharophilus TaxID=361277 RepID=A0AAX2EDL2_9BACI|nr:two-component system, NarL family, sensor histidine kinase YdfH [Terribacillus saccharophilus]
MDNHVYAQNNIKQENNNMVAARIPGLIWIFVTFTASLIIQIVSGSSVLHCTSFSLLIIIFSTFYWFSNRFLPRRAWMYFVVQGLIVYGSAFLMYNVSVTIIALFPLLLGQLVGMVGRNRVAFFVILSGLSIIASVIIIPSEGLFTYFVIVIPATLIIVAYAAIFFKQVNARIRTQQILQELEEAHHQVENLTLYSERQRMARDLHDTLAQGIAGIKMQLEAINAHLTNGNQERAQQIAQLAMKGASSVLADSRIVIDDLRLHEENIDLEYILRENTQQFTTATAIPCSLNYEVMQSLSPKITEHLSRIVSECLLNIARHSRASEVFVSIKSTLDTRIRLKVEDNGVGFDTEEISNKQGHYGLIGMKERVRILGGEIRISSTLGEGTTVTVSIPENGED